MNDESLNHLKTLFLIAPKIGKYVSNYLCNLELNSTITIKTIQNISDIITNLLNKYQYQQLYQFLSYLKFTRKEEIKFTLTNLFQLLIQRSTSCIFENNDSKNKNSKLWKHLIYDGLLAADNGVSLLEYFNTLEDNLYIDNNNSLRTSYHNLYNNNDDNNKEVMFWYNWYQYHRCNNIHFAETFIKECLNCISLRQFSQLEIMFNKIPELSILVLVIAWDTHLDIIINDNLFGKLSTELLKRMELTCKDNDLLQTYKSISYLLQMTWWCFDKIHGNIIDLFKTIKNSSLLFVIQSLLPQISFEEINNKMIDNPNATSNKYNDVDLLLLFTLTSRFLEFIKFYLSSTNMPIFPIHEFSNRISLINSSSVKIRLFRLLLCTLTLNFDDFKSIDTSSSNPKYLINLSILQIIIELYNKTNFDCTASEELGILQQTIETIKQKLVIIMPIADMYPYYNYQGASFLLFSSFNTLFNLSLRYHLFDICSYILNNFKLEENNVKDTVILLKIYHKLLNCRTINSLLVELNSEIHNISDRDRLYLLLNSSLMEQWHTEDSYKLLSESCKLITQLNKIEDNVIIYNSLSKFINSLVAKLENLNEVKISNLFSDSDYNLSEPSDSPHLQSISFELVQQIQQIIQTCSGKDSELYVKESINNIILNLNRVTTTTPYLLLFLKHIILLGDTLLPTHSEYNYFKHLDTTPQLLLSNLVYSYNKYDTAEKLSSELLLDLLAIIVKPPQTKIDNSNNNNNNELTISILEYIYKCCPPLSPLVAIFRLPLQSNYKEFVSYAATTSKSFPVLYYYVQYIFQAFDTIQQFTLSNAVGEPEDNSVTLNIIKNNIDLITNDKIAFQIEFYTNMVINCIEKGNIEIAIQILKTYNYLIDLQKLEPILLKLTNQTEPSKYITQIVSVNDVEFIANFIIKHIHNSNWDIIICCDALLKCVCYLSTEFDNYKTIVKLFKQLEIINQVLKFDINKWTTWQLLYKSCQEELIVVIRYCIQLSQYEVAKQICTCFDGDISIIEEIEISYILDLFNNQSSEKAILYLTGLLNSVKIAQSLLNVADNYTIKFYLVQFLLEKYPVDTEIYTNFKTLFVTYKIMCKLSEEWQKRLCKLENEPSLLVESLIMSEQTSELVWILNEFPTIIKQETLIEYATKAMSIQRNNNNSNSNSVSSNSKSLLNSTSKLEDVTIESLDSWSTIDKVNDIMNKQFIFILTGNEIDDNNIRQEHSYASAPSVNLTKSLLSVCDNKSKSGSACVSICKELSNYLEQIDYSQLPKLDNAVILSLLQDLLYFAKLQFIQDDEAEQAHSVDTLLSHLELYQSLLINEALPLNFKLVDLSDKQKARQLRDKLISEDRMKLAITVATKCNLESDPVWAAWGLALLKLGKYSEAKEKFGYCLVTVTDTVIHSETANKLVNEIIQVLERGDTISDANSLRQQYLKLVNSSKRKTVEEINKEQTSNSTNSVINSPQRVKSFVSSLDSSRLMQCIYYLKKYGSAKSLIRFWIKHGLLEDACQYIFNTQLPVSLFLEEVLHYSLSHMQLSSLQKAIKKADPSMQSSKPYLDAMCKFFNEKKTHKILLDFLLFVNDYVRAGLTCIKLFMEEQDNIMQMKYLENAKTYLLDGMTNSIEETVISESEIARHIKSITLQMQINKYLSNQPKGSVPMHLNVFGSGVQRSCMFLCIYFFQVNIF